MSRFPDKTYCWAEPISNRKQDYTNCSRPAPYTQMQRFDLSQAPISIHYSIWSCLWLAKGATAGQHAFRWQLQTPWQNIVRKPSQWVAGNVSLATTDSLTQWVACMVWWGLRRKLILVGDSCGCRFFLGGDLDSHVLNLQVKTKPTMMSPLASYSWSLRCGDTSGVATFLVRSPLLRRIQW
jgi:hypothetical protein